MCNDLSRPTNKLWCTGYETTANALSYAVNLLARNPEAESKLVEEVNRLRDGYKLSHSKWLYT